MKNNQDETTNGLESAGGGFRTPRVFREQSIPRKEPPRPGPADGGLRASWGGSEQTGDTDGSDGARCTSAGQLRVVSDELRSGSDWPSPGRRRTVSSLCVSVNWKRTFVFREDRRLAHPPFAVERWQSLAWSCLRSGQVQRSRSEAGSRGWECSLLEDPSLQVVGPKCDKNKKCVGEVMET